MRRRWPNLLAIFIIAVSSTATVAVNSVRAGAEIDGQVFIVTGGHESVKLGLVPIAAFKLDEFAQSIAHVRSQIDEERPRLERIRPIVDKAKELTTNLGDSIIRDRKYDAIGHSAELEAKAETLVWRIDRRSEYLNSAAPFFKALPKPLATTKTDADGKFRLALASEDPVVVAATATRVTPGDKENYFWAVRFKPPGAITLSSDNLTDAASDESALQTKSLSGSPNPDDSADVLSAELEAFKISLVKFCQELVPTMKFPELNAYMPIPVASPTRMFTLTKSVSIQTPHGSVVLQRGTKLAFIAREGDDVRFRYINADYAIPVSVTDLK